MSLRSLQVIALTRASLLLSRTVARKKKLASGPALFPSVLDSAPLVLPSWPGVSAGMGRPVPQTTRRFAACKCSVLDATGLCYFRALTLLHLYHKVYAYLKTKTSWVLGCIFAQTSRKQQNVRSCIRGYSESAPIHTTLPRVICLSPNEYLHSNLNSTLISNFTKDLLYHVSKCNSGGRDEVDWPNGSWTRFEGCLVEDLEWFREVRYGIRGTPLRFLVRSMSRQVPQEGSERK
jgi:hypothetical protein